MKVHTDYVKSCSECPFSWLQKNETLRCIHDFIVKPEHSKHLLFMREEGRKIYIKDEPSCGYNGVPSWCPLKLGSVLVALSGKAKVHSQNDEP
jgi:hypothetical protein